VAAFCAEGGATAADDILQWDGENEGAQEQRNLGKCRIPKFSIRNVNHFPHKKLKISKRFHLF
jgi:hypothetical protein